MARSLPCVALACLFGIACEKEPPTYLGAAKAVVDAKCTGCHVEGGIAPFPLTTFEEIEPVADLVRAAVETETMPPWLASDDCNTYSNDFSLTVDEKALLLEWIDTGLAEGDAAQSAEGEGALTTSPIAVNIRYDELFDAATEPYTPDDVDDYRCFAIAWPYTAADGEKYITGFDMIPGDASNVHHVNIFLNPPDDEVDFVQYDLEDPAPGFSCGRGDRILSSSLVGAWAPGASGIAYPEGTGQLVEPGSSITLEVHYALPTGVPDASQLALEVESTVERRGLGVAFWWFNNWDNDGMPIPAGNPSVTHEVTVNPALELAVIAPWIETRNIEIHVAALHMHALGSKGELSVKSPVGDSCLLKIDRFDYHWQNGHVLEKPVEIFLGAEEDQLFLSCTWDNSAEHQPYIDGVQQEPRDVNWGSGVNDEMCIGFLYMVPVQ